MPSLLCYHGQSMEDHHYDDLTFRYKPNTFRYNPNRLRHWTRFPRPTGISDDTLELAVKDPDRYIWFTDLSGRTILMTIFPTCGYLYSLIIAIDGYLLRVRLISKIADGILELGYFSNSDAQYLPIRAEERNKNMTLVESFPTCLSDAHDYMTKAFMDYIGV